LRERNGQISLTAVSESFDETLDTPSSTEMLDDPKIPAKRARSQRAMIPYQEGKAGSSGLQAFRFHRKNPDYIRIP
jgi:hypothetical protein